MKNAATVEDSDEGFNFLNLEDEGYTMKSCDKSGSKTAMKSCVNQLLTSNVAHLVK